MSKLQYDPVEAVAHLRRVDPRLRAIIDAAGPFTVVPDPDMDVFQALMRSIVFQQLSGKAASTILGRVLDLWGGRFPTPAELVVADPDVLRGAGLSRSKAAALLDLALKSDEGVVPTPAEADALDDASLVERLVSVRGVGPWTVEMLLLFRLGRGDVLPVADLGVRKGMARTYDLEELPTPDEMRQISEPWRPYRSVGSWYMWRAVDLEELPL